MHSSSMLPKFVGGVRYIASFRNWTALKPKIKSNFDILNPPIKTRGAVGEMSYAEQSSIIVTQGGSIRFARSSSISSHNASKVTGVKN